MPKKKATKKKVYEPCPATPKCTKWCGSCPKPGEVQFVTCPECGSEQADMGKNVAWPSASYG